MSKPPVTVTLTWNHTLEFTAESGPHQLITDGSSQAAPSPMVLLATALAGCMAIDLVHILTRGRQAISALKTTLQAERSPEEPHRFVKVDLKFDISTSASPEQIERALDLSRNKYCSVWNSLREDIELNVSYELTRVEESAAP